MLSLDEDKLMAEIAAQRKSRDDALDGIKELVERYPGSWYANGAPGHEADFDSENASFEYLSFQMSQLVWANPRVRVITRRQRAQQFVAEAMNWGINRWIADTDLKTCLEDLAVDFSFAWGVAHVTQSPRIEAYEPEDPALWPQLSRISPWDFGWDHRAPTFRRARMMWHRYRIDREDLLEVARLDRKLPKDRREGWIYAAVDGLSTASAAEKRTRHLFGRDALEDEPDREELEIVEVYLPGHQLPGEPGPRDGFNGTIVTLGCAGKDDEHGVMLREPRPFYGPRWGPYSLLGAYIVPDSTFPLSLLCATAGHIEQARRLSQAVDRQVAAYKRFGLASATAGDLPKTIKDAKNDHVYRMTQAGDVAQIFKEFEIGGTTSPNLAAEMRAIEKRNRAMGMDDAQRGSVTGEGTATEVQIATEAALGRQGYVKSRFQDGIRRALKTVAWYLYHSDQVIIPLGQEVADSLDLESLGLPPDAELWFRGGSHDEASGVSYDDLGLEIEPYSMERPSESFLRQRGAFLAGVVQMAPGIAMLAQLGGDVKGILDALGDANGMPNLSRYFPGIETADLSAILPEQAQPRLGRDTGAVGAMRTASQAGKSTAVGGGGGRGQRSALEAMSA